MATTCPPAHGNDRFESSCHAQPDEGGVPDGISNDDIQCQTKQCEPAAQICFSGGKIRVGHEFVQGSNHSFQRAEHAHLGNGVFTSLDFRNKHPATGDGKALSSA